MKLIDADALRAWISTQKANIYPLDIIDHIDTLPDAGCAAQAELDALRAAIDDAVALLADDACLESYALAAIVKARQG